jgi:peptide/nickel transport system permease protein
MIISINIIENRSLKFVDKRHWNKFKKRKINFVALAIIVLLVIIAIFAPNFSPYEPLAQDYENILLPPSRSHIFGTDNLGRDIFSRVIYGSRITVQIGLFASILACSLGLIQGLIAGYFGGILDTLIMRFTDILLSIPTILLAIAIIAILGPSINTLIFAIAIASMSQFTRVVRGTVLYVKEYTFVLASRAIGQGDLNILFKHILPNILGPVIVLATIRVAGAILVGAALSFVGLGAQPPTPEWGALLNEARIYLRTAWWFTLFPGMTLAVTILSINILGDSLRDIFDPKTYYS